MMQDISQHTVYECERAEDWESSSLCFIYVQKVRLPPQRLATQSKLKAELRATFTLVLHLVPTLLHLFQPLRLLALPVFDRISSLDARHGLS